MEKKSYFLICLVLIVVPLVPLQLLNAQSAPGILITDISPNRETPANLRDGDIVYMRFDPENPPILRLQLSLVGGVTQLSPSTNLPLGSVFDASHRRFTWDLDTLCKPGKELGPQCMEMLPQSFGINFVATSPSNPDDIARASVYVVVESTPSPVSITFDRTGYQPGSTATVTITDPYSKTNILLPSRIDSSKVVVRLSNPLGALVKIINGDSFEQSTHDLDRFTATIQIPISLPSGTITAKYNDLSSTADVGLAIWFDSSMYNIDETPTLTVFDPSADLSASKTDEIFAIMTTNLGNTQLSTKLVETKMNSGVFTADLPFSAFEGKVGTTDIPDRIVYSMKYKNQKAEATILQPSFNFSKSLYGSTDVDFAILHLVNKKANVDKNLVDVVETAVRAADGQPITNILQETGLNTGEFYSISKIPLLPDPHLIPEYGEKGLVVSDGITISASLPSLSDVAARADVNVPDGEPHDHPDLNGTGSSGALPTTIRTIFSGIDVIDCGSYGGDSDWDGICDQWESQPYTNGPLKIPYPSGGVGILFNTPYNTCDPTCPNKNHKDVYMEIDYASGFVPNPTAISNVKAKFNAVLNSEFDSARRNPDGTNGIRLHVKVSDDVGTSPLAGNTVNLWSNTAGNDINIPTSAAMCNLPQDSFSKIKQCRLGVGHNYFTNPGKTLAWQQVVHYVYWGNKQTHDPGASGVAEVVGDDLFVSLGSFGGGGSAVEIQQGTLMHELGHNLGLNHGGGLKTYPIAEGDPATYDWYPSAWINCIPQYISVMSHSRQITNAFTGNTLDYSHGWFTPSNIQQNVSAIIPSLMENNLPKPVGAPAGTLVTIYFGYNTGGVRGQQTVQGDASIFPNTNPNNGINIVPNKIDWDHDGTFEALGGPNDVFDVGLGHRCARADGNNPNIIANPNKDQIHDHNDWKQLVLDFRNWNPAGIATGSSAVAPGMSIDELNRLRVAGVVWLSEGIQNLESQHFDGNATKIKADFERELISGHNSVAVLANNSATVKAAATTLEKLRLLMDGSKGGDSTDDLIRPKGQAVPLARLDNNLVVFELGYDKPYTANTDKEFKVTSLLDGTTYTIFGESDTITAAVPTFTVDDDNKQIILDLIGGIGELTLEIPIDITDSINSVTEVGTCNDIPVTQIRSNSGGTIKVKLENVGVNPRAISLTYGDTILTPGCPEQGLPSHNEVTTSAPLVVDITNNPIRDLVVGTQVVLATNIMNSQAQVQPFVALIEVRDSDGITVYLAWQTGVLGRNSDAQVGLSWIPNVADSYEIRTFVITDLKNPQILTPIAMSTFDVM